MAIAVEADNKRYQDQDDQAGAGNAKGSKPDLQVIQCQAKAHTDSAHAFVKAIQGIAQSCHGF